MAKNPQQNFSTYKTTNVYGDKLLVEYNKRLLAKVFEDPNTSMWLPYFVLVVTWLLMVLMFGKVNYAHPKFGIHGGGAWKC